MAQWATFVGVTGVVLVLLLVLSHLTQSSVSDGGLETAVDAGVGTDSDTDSVSDPQDPDASDLEPDSDPDPELLSGRRTGAEPELDGEGSDTDADTESASRAQPLPPLEREPGPERRPGPAHGGRGGELDPGDLSTGMLLANVALSQGLFAFVLLGAVLYTGIPADALGVEFSVGYLERGLLLGTAAGLVLYVGNEVGSALATRFGFDHDEELRELLAPDSLRGWAVLLLAVLPIIAVFEELLFRAALIGVIWTHYGIDPWLLAAGSSIAFAIGHGMQGSVGIVVTGALGFVLAGIFIVTESLLVVVVAHYLVNALEFAVHEGFEIDWAAGLEGAGSRSSAEAGDDGHG